MRKPILVTLLLLITCSFVHAQLNKNSWLTGGNIGINYSNSKSESVTDSKGMVFSISPDIGYFIFNRFAAGVNLSAAFATSKYTDINGIGQKGKPFVLGVGPFLRYYLLKNNSPVNILIEPGFFYKNVKELNGGEDLPTFEYYVAAGPVIFLNKSVAMELTGSYTSGKYMDNSMKYRTIQVNLGLQVHLFKK